MKTFARIIKPNFVSKLLTKRAFLLVAVLAVAGAGVAVVAKVNAVPYTFTVGVQGRSVLEISLTDAAGDPTTGDTLDIAPTMTTAVFDETALNVTVATSNATGFVLRMETTSQSLNDTTTASLIPTLEEKAGGYTCTPATSATCNFTVNHWGYQLTADTNILTAGNYLPVPASVRLDEYSGVTDGETTSLKFGTRINAQQPAGNYTTTINFVATAKPLAEEYMQTVTSSTLATRMSAVGSTTVLYDNRDDNMYTIGKLKDGKYWMLDNLSLDPTDLNGGVTLSSANTHMPAEDTAGFGAAFTASMIKTDGFTSYTVPMINTASKAKTYSYGDGQGQVGVYYNYCAATVGTYCYDSSSGTGNAQYDICPKNWRMPTSAEYVALYGAYAGDNQVSLFKNALRTPLSGNFYVSSASYQGSYGVFWSSTRYNASSMYGLRVNASDVNPQNSGSRLHGFSVRCVFDGS